MFLHFAVWQIHLLGKVPYVHRTSYKYTYIAIRSCLDFIDNDKFLNKAFYDIYLMQIYLTLVIIALPWSLLCGE